VVAVWRGAVRERELGQLKSDFVSTVSHELRTPLTSIRMFGEMLREGVAGDDAERTRKYHDVIVRESERLSRLIANVLDFSQIERGARRYDRRRVTLAEIAEEAVATYRRLADGEAAPLALELEPGAGSAVCDGDREALAQSLLNLLSNAAKYGGDRPVTVRVAAAAQPARIAVTAEGPGISASELKRVFKAFYRAPEARRSGAQGTGLGLALVKRHVEALGGRVEVDSVPGRGSTFAIVMPRCA
jgi:signal transduction histidine kinase